MAGEKKTGCLMPMVAFFGLAIVVSALGSVLKVEKGSNTANRQSDGDKKMELGRQLAKDMATGEMILTASCLAKEGKISRDKIGDYVAAGAAEQGITRAELFDNWDRKYWPLAKEAEKRNRTACLD
jgi:hypothetical protein